MGDAGESPSSHNPPPSPQYFQPAEHLPHSHTLTAFPNLPGCYQDAASTSAARREVAAIATAISHFEPVWLYAHPAHARIARALVNDNDNQDVDVVVKEAEVDNLWIRDLGPVFLHSPRTGKTAAVDFNFNYWGHKAEETVDGAFARRVLASREFGHVETVQAGIVSEGGALEVDGEGTLMVTDTSIVNENRNPGMGKREIEAELKRVLGVRKVIWLKGVEGLESTDWHVDAWCRFVRPGKVLLSKPPLNAHKEIRAIFEDALRVLAQETDAKGRRLEVVVVDEPDQEKLAGGTVEGMVTSYVNYLLVNGGVVMAKFGDEEPDEKALALIKELFPERKVVQVYINELPRLGGGIHCATQHVPV
ncbi:uncharacterized protein HMPREF1541_01540 [Cyphellophora europaea CBS 101466]|uniref:Agmatine deiminase n=1 Tax=Cyphellophora europaea (strain CBS 101466) TaxID=1220924 RepID=W2S119_CYPE1|nr:uncharacterized protein HMPREF1541_01540 [Cyphellophora europaea CBS 101466]ETN42386.1 hypothetical protein HMPREF1541_01540 [Cyphellophora europaea CBS 101466]